MRVHPIIPVLALAAAFDATIAQAQQTARRVEGRLVPGVALQRGIFGDDSPRTGQETGITIGGQVVARRSGRFAWVFEGALQPNALRNPHFDETVSSLYLQFGPEFGRRVHVRPTVGIALQSWSGSRACGCFDAAPAAGVAVGVERAVGQAVRMTPEVFARGSIGYGIFQSSMGVQVGVGWGRK
jgi:hypothetical protein